jgi:hypothetical protein
LKVYIGPYRNWIGPYQIAKLLKYVKVSEDKCNKIGGRLSKIKWLMKLCEWIDSKKHIKRKIRIDNYDLWSMDYTLSHIIYPMLVKMKKMKHGAPYVNDEDVPDGIGLRSTEATPVEDWKTDDNFFSRWDWVLDQMIWSFEQLATDKDEIFIEDKEERDKYNEKLHNGFKLFGKYYMTLWD